FGNRGWGGAGGERDIKPALVLARADAPGLQTARLEGELPHRAAPVLERAFHLQAAFKVAVEHHIAAPAGAVEFAAQRAGGTRGGVEIVNARVADARRQALLRFPSLVQQRPELVQPA